MGEGWGYFPKKSCAAKTAEKTIGNREPLGHEIRASAFHCLVLIFDVKKFLHKLLPKTFMPQKLA